MGGDQLQDEYGDMDSDGETYVYPGDFKLENGEILTNPQIRYNTWGELNATRDNVLVICHALTGNARIDSWWSDLLGPGKAFDTSKYMVVGANILGSCYGSTGPTSINPATSQPYGSSFPAVAVRDTVRLHMQMVKDEIKVRKIFCVIGGSFGGMQALEWAYMGRDGFVHTVAPFSCGVAHTAWQIGISETQRQAIYADPKWRGGHFPADDPPLAGLSVARQVAMTSYRTQTAFQGKFGRGMQNGEGDPLTVAPNWQVRSYLEHQGRKFLTRFDPLTYVRLTEQMDTHDVGRGRGGASAALAECKQPAVIISIDSDILYPPSEQREIADLMPASEYHTVNSAEGHDGFLLEQKQITKILSGFLSEQWKKYEHLKNTTSSL